MEIELQSQLSMVRKDTRMEIIERGRNMGEVKGEDVLMEIVPKKKLHKRSNENNKYAKGGGCRIGREETDLNQTYWWGSMPSEICVHIPEKQNDPGSKECGGILR